MHPEASSCGRAQEHTATSANNPLDLDTDGNRARPFKPTAQRRRRAVRIGNDPTYLPPSAPGNPLDPPGAIASVVNPACANRYCIELSSFPPPTRSGDSSSWTTTPATSSPSAPIRRTPSHRPATLDTAGHGPWRNARDVYPNRADRTSFQFTESSPHTDHAEQHCVARWYPDALRLFRLDPCPT